MINEQEVHHVVTSYKDAPTRNDFMPLPIPIKD